MVAGVAAGLAEHLRLDVRLLRALFVLLTLAQLTGVVMYAAFWALVPLAEPDAGAAPRPGRGLGRRGIAVVAVVGVVGVLGTVLDGQRLAAPMTPLAVAAIGMALLWRQADDAQRARWTAISGRLPGRIDWRQVATGDGRPSVALLRIIAGGLLVVVGLVGFLAANDALAQARDGLLATMVIVVGVALVSAPWWWRMASDLASERRERIRSQQRAEIAAHLHDSVLQTLALIQRHADDPRSVQSLARSQERELRGWLYRPPGAAEGSSLAAALEAAAAEVEEAHGVPVEVVVVGGAGLDDRLAAVVQAAREAMVNAARASGASVVSVYAEAAPDAVEVFVRDRGCGFDPATVPTDRYGIAESIVGRLGRHGGSAQVRSIVGEGTEVHLRLPLPAAATAPGVPVPERREP